MTGDTMSSRQQKKCRLHPGNRTLPFHKSQTRLILKQVENSGPSLHVLATGFKGLVEYPTHRVHTVYTPCTHPGTDVLPCSTGLTSLTTCYHNVQCLWNTVLGFSCVSHAPCPWRAHRLVVEHIETTCPKHRCQAFGLCHAMCAHAMRDAPWCTEKQPRGKHTAKMEKHSEKWKKHGGNMSQHVPKIIRNMFKHVATRSGCFKKTRTWSNLSITQGMDSALQWKTVQTARLDSKGQQGQGRTPSSQPSGPPAAATAAATAAAVAVTTATTKDDHDDREGERKEAWQIRTLHDLFSASP